jgi:plastocyanin
VSRAFATLAVLAAVTVTLFGLSPESGPIGGGAEAAAANCSWQRHAKRIVTHVKRHGRARRLVRVKRWWSCDPLAVPAAIGASPSLPAAPGSPPGSEPVPGPARLSIKALEYSFTLSRPSIPAGEAIVELNNQGEDPHNLNLRLEGGEEPPLEVSEAGPLEHRTARFDLPAGSYRLWCSLPEHEEKGMKAVLVVGSD